jgi:hypothetical protein
VTAGEDKADWMRRLEGTCKSVLLNVSKSGWLIKRKQKVSVEEHQKQSGKTNEWLFERRPTQR